MQYKTVIFDLDGTLLNTLADLAASVNYALGHFGYPNRTLEEIRSFVGNGIKTLVELSLPNGDDNTDFEEAYALFRAHYWQNCAVLTRPYDGIPELLELLAQNGASCAIVSNKNDAAVRKLRQIYFPRNIAAALGNTEGMPKKPAPDSVLAVMERLGAESLSTLYVGDSEVDYHTARNAGLQSILVSWGFRGRKELSGLPDAVIVDKPTEIAEIVLGNK